jgi:serine/threonine-protein kinase
MQETARWVGRTLRDKWHIDSRISRGGVGTVFAATHRNNGSRVAIKVLHPEFSRDQDTRSRFLQEGYAANQVNHPGVVRILDDDTAEDGSAYLVMELLEGELLERRRMNKGGKLPIPEVYEIADQLLDVLVAAHDKGIVHRDIKPDNLFLTKGGRLKVLDFGFAQMKSGFRKEQTATGYLLVTPGFMSPEQAIGARGQVDAQTDIWAVGATMFTLLSGHPVHDGESAAEMLVAAANFPARSLAQVEPDLPLRLVEIVDRAHAFDKTDRWPSARSMQVALRCVPGRQALGGAGWDSGRRSVPDGYPTVRDVQDERTLAESAM